MNIVLLCLALDTAYLGKPIYIDMNFLHTVIRSEQELKNVKNAICNINLIDVAMRQWAEEDKKNEKFN